MSIDNDLYNHLSATWWDEDEALGILRSWFGPVRFGYFQKVLLEEYKMVPQEQSVLDVGCGGGLLSEEFARRQFRVTGIDPSEASLTIARQHAQQSGLAITYQTGLGEHLPFADASFNIVVCCDVLEHVDDIDQVIQEIARVLVPGGIFCYDTINRTFLSWLVHIKMAQEWRITSFMPANLHVWHKFIRPQELLHTLEQHHLHNHDLKGMSPQTHPLNTIRYFLQQKRRVITLSQMGKGMRFHASRDLSTSYMGYAVKDASPHSQE